MIERFPRQRTSVEVVFGLSIRVTEAPLSARINPAKGPGARPANYRRISGTLIGKLSKE